MLEDIPVLEAAEALHAVNVAQVGAGVMKRYRASSLLRRWSALARRGSKRRHAPATPQQWMSKVAASGIKVEVRNGG